MNCMDNNTLETVTVLLDAGANIREQWVFNTPYYNMFQRYWNHI